MTIFLLFPRLLKETRFLSPRFSYPQQKKPAKWQVYKILITIGKVSTKIQPCL